MSRRRSHDFCCIDNAVQANLLAATVNDEGTNNQMYNVAVGEQTSLKLLFEAVTKTLESNSMGYQHAPLYPGFRSGDVLHSLVDPDKVGNSQGYTPSYRTSERLAEAVAWYVAKLQL